MINLQERILRSRKFFITNKIHSSSDLFYTYNITNKNLENLKSSIVNFILESLVSFFPKKKFIYSNDILIKYESYIQKLPNITYNGLILPKKQNLCSFNQVQKNFVKLIVSYGFENIDSIQFPVNIRIQSGKKNIKLDQRPRSSVKRHTDIWAGDPSNGYVIFLPILGDIVSSGVTLYDVKYFPMKYFRSLNDYNEAKEFTKKLIPIEKLRLNKLYFVDSFMIHSTYKKAKGLRLSLDSRITVKNKVSSDGVISAQRRKFFLNYKKWSELGNSMIIYTNEELVKFKDKNRNKFTQSYPVKIQTINVKNNEIKSY